MVKVFSIDWFAANFIGAVENKGFFEFEPLGYGSRQFGLLHTVKWRGFDVGTVASCPTLPSLPKSFLQFKMDNAWLYDSAFEYIVEDLMGMLGWKWHSLSRLDLAMDFHCFENGLAPQDFIKRFMGGKYSLVSKAKFAVYGEADGKNSFESLTIGSRQSPCRVYLYNKTKELNEVAYKSWIVNAWEKAGLDKSRDVWRLEVSIKHDGMKLVEVDSGDVFGFDWKDVKDRFAMCKVYESLVSRYFRFVPYSESKNRYRLPVLKLFGWTGLTLRRYRDVPKVKTNRSDKIFAAKLGKEMNVGCSVVSDFRMNAILWANDWIVAHGLEDYCEMRNCTPKV